MVTIAHISDLHCSKTTYGKIGFRAKKLISCIKEINKLKPDLVVVTGDLTAFGFEEEFKLAKKYLSKIKPHTLVIPGNHDSRYCGYDYFDKHFGHGNIAVTLPGIDIIGVDTTVPDLDTGNVGRGKFRWLLSELEKMPKKNCKIVAMHHHLIPIPKTGRERGTIADAGTVLESLVNAGVDVVLCGHKHTPDSWFINDVAIVNAGSVSAIKLRVHINNSYNLIKIEDGTVNVLLKEVSKKPRLWPATRQLFLSMVCLCQNSYRANV